MSITCYSLTDPKLLRRLELHGPLPATLALSLGLVGVHLITAAWLWHGGDDAWSALLGTRSVRARIALGGQYSPAIASWPPRLFTSVLLHVDALHLLVNVTALATLGRLLEPLLGSARWLAVFALGGLGGSVASHALGVAQSDGASAGAFALLATGVVLARRWRDDLPPDDARLLGPMLAGFGVANLILSLVVPALDAAAHLGGALTGVALGAWMPLGPDDRWARAVCLVWTATAAIGWCLLR